jgi:hypothetical protein
VSARVVTALALVAALALLGGCAGEPEPVETTPAFASEEEAFAAAEETYRAYVDALNDVDLSDPETFEPVFALTTGDANANARRTFSEMHANGWTVDGDSTYENFRGVSVTVRGAAREIVADVCLDVTGVEVIDASGESMVSADRLDRQPVTVALSTSGPLEDLRILSSESTGADACES